MRPLRATSAIARELALLDLLPQDLTELAETLRREAHLLGPRLRQRLGQDRPGEQRDGGGQGEQRGGVLHVVLLGPGTVEDSSTEACTPSAACARLPPCVAPPTTSPRSGTTARCSSTASVSRT